jgi:hypothetical protein
MQHRLGTLTALAVVLCGLRALGLAADLPASIQVQTASGISYFSGGVSAEERDALRHVGGEYTVKLVFAAKAGDYLSDVQVTIMDGQGKQILAAVSGGPWFYAKLPSGKYTVMAQVRGQTQQQVAEVKQQQQTQLQFYW